MEKGFRKTEITEEIFARIKGKSYKDYCTLPLSELSYLQVLHWDFDEYDAVDEAAMADNNSSAFNYRTISYSDVLSNHSLGRAIDINPLYNPYVKMVDGRLSCEPTNGAAYMDREREFPHKITAEDPCCQIFKKHGFAWGGDWEHAKDYQHFDKVE